MELYSKSFNLRVKLQAYFYCWLLGALAGLETVDGPQMKSAPHSSRDFRRPCHLSRSLGECP